LIGYCKYAQFLAAFPTLPDLAAALPPIHLGMVTLGYNMRAVRLQSIARQVIAEYDGHIPILLMTC